MLRSRDAGALLDVLALVTAGSMVRAQNAVLAIVAQRPFRNTRLPMLLC